MRLHYLSLIGLTLCVPAARASAIPVNLGTADSFAVLAGSTVTNTGSTTIHGDLGVSPGSAVTGFPPGVISGGTIHMSDAVAMQAQNDLTTAYNFAANETCGQDLTGMDLGGRTLTPGVFCFTTSAQLTGVLTLNALGDPNAAFVFKIGSTLTTASSSSVVFINGGEGDSVFWQIGSSATLGTTTDFAGSLLANASITLNTGATLGCGRALARSGAVTLDSNHLSIDTATCETTARVDASAPEPGTNLLLGLGMFPALIFCAWRKRFMPGCSAVTS